MSVRQPRLTLTPLVGLSFAGASLTEHDDIAPGSASFGTPVWSPGALLANLELRLGLPTPLVAETVRAQRWARRLDELLTTGARFYSASYAIDRLGTATALLAMRDELVMAGWDGGAVRGGGERLETFAALEADIDLPPGDADRLRLVEHELRAITVAPFDALFLAEPAAAWSGRWQRVFVLLAERGTHVEHRPTSFAPIDGDGDLACVQRALCGATCADGALRGDGSFILLHGETSWELGHTVAALVRAWADPRTVVVRGGDPSALDGALSSAGLACQGVEAPSTCRPMLQLLPLAIELAFEPRDPYRVLEILTLPSGPFDGFVGSVLSRAMAGAPGIGGRPWREAKNRIAEAILSASAAGNEEADREARARAVLAKIEQWLELPGHPVRDGAPRDALLAVADRVIEWFRVEFAGLRAKAEADPANIWLAARSSVQAAAFAQARDFRDALVHDARERLDLVDARLLMEQVARAHALPLTIEHAGRVDVADGPPLLRAHRDVVVWWHCVAETEWRPYPRSWRRREVDALRNAGALLPDLSVRLASEASAWRQVVLAARRRLVLAIPRRYAGEPLEPHPIVDEIVGRLRLEAEDLARVTIDASTLLDDRGRSIATRDALPMVDLDPLELPEARAEWRVGAGVIGSPAEYSASSFEELVSCPLRWVLSRGARLRAGSLASIPSGPLLHGKLGHRVVEELHRGAALSTPQDVSSRFSVAFERLVREEGSVLLRPGMTFELVRLRLQLERSLRRLAELLADAGLRIADVEAAITCEWRGRPLTGSLDLLLVGGDGHEVVLDLKWGASSYRDLLKHGRSIQLATYTAARSLMNETAAAIPGAYFSIKQGAALATEGIFDGVRPIDGPPLRDTWSNLARTVERLEALLAAGRLPVTGHARSLPLLQAIGVDSADAGRHVDVGKDAICKYCSFDAICGKRWEAYS